MPYPQDGVYDHTRPWASNEERLTGDALAAAAGMSSAEIANIRPPIPRIGLLPDRFGFAKQYLRINDIVRIDQIYPGARVDYSGSQSGYQGSSFPSLSQF